MRATAILMALALLCSAGTAAAQSNKLGIHISASTDDPVGRKLAYHFRDAVGRSGTFNEVPAGGRGVRASLVTIDPNDDGIMTAYSLTLLINNDDGLDYYVTSYVGVCGSGKVASCAQSMLTDIGGEIEVLRQALSKQRTDFHD